MRASDSHGLRRLAALLGIQASYRDSGGVYHRARTEALEAVALALLRESGLDVGSALARLERERSGRLTEPVHVIWLPGPAAVHLSPEAAGSARLECTLRGEGHTWDWPADARSLAPDRNRLLLRLPDLAAGYYEFTVTARRRSSTSTSSALVIASPARAYRHAGGAKEWGAFLPLYALASQRSWGCGDLSDLRSLALWTRELGGSSVATLPLLSTFLEGPIFDPSPYSPASRLMWNEIYVDPVSLPDLAASESARALVASPDFQRDVDALRASRLVDYRRLAALKTEVLREIAASLSSSRRRDLDRFLEERPEVAQYARFRARAERHGSWQTWSVPDPPFDPQVERSHAYAQWSAEEQLAALAHDESAAGLYMDLPLGVNAAGYDVWRWPESFVHVVSVGAPPDLLATAGQDWGFPPPHPTADRERGYPYFRAVIRHHMRHSSRLRVDHVMGLHRLYCIPHGFEARDGVYVRYHADELYAVLSLESHRHRCEVVGENLGTVPDYVNRALRRRGVSGMYVLPFELDEPPQAAIRTPGRSSVASLNTHDLPTFAAWWSARDISLRVDIGWQSPNDAARERRERRRLQDAVLSFLLRRGLLTRATADSAAVFKALLTFLGRSPARLVLVNLEDLWMETEPQNVPGTSALPNWRRKARHSLDYLRTLSQVLSALATLDGARKHSHQPVKPEVERGQ